MKSLFLVLYSDLFNWEKSEYFCYFSSFLLLKSFDSRFQFSMTIWGSRRMSARGSCNARCACINWERSLPVRQNHWSRVRRSSACETSSNVHWIVLCNGFPEILEPPNAFTYEGLETFLNVRMRKSSKNFLHMRIRQAFSKASDARILHVFSL